MDFVIGGVAAMGAGLFTNPLDVVRVRMQLQGELRKRGTHVVHYRGLGHGVYVIAKTEGILALQKGLVPALCYQMLQNGVRLGLYQTMEDSGMTKNSKGEFRKFHQLCCAATAGACASCFSTPMYLIRTQLQSKAAATIAVGVQHQHTGILQAAKHIYQSNGLKGFWQGFSATVLRSSMAAGVQLPTFGQAKMYLKKNYPYFNESPISCAFVASLIGGAVMILFVNPCDVLATRLANQDVDAQGRGLLYRNVFDCAGKIWKSEGVLGFYKGLKITYLRTAPHTVLVLVFWDQLKKLKDTYLE